MKFPVFKRSSRGEAPAETTRQKSLLEIVREKRQREVSADPTKYELDTGLAMSKQDDNFMSDDALRRDFQSLSHVPTSSDHLWHLARAPKLDPQSLACVRAAQSITATAAADCVATRPREAAPDPSLVPIAETFFHSLLLPVQQHLVPILSMGVPCVVVGPKGSGKRTAALYACGVTADVIKRSLRKARQQPVGPLSIVVTSCTEEQRWAKGRLEDAFGDRVSISVATPPKECKSWTVDGDVWVTTAFHLCNLLEQSSSGGDEETQEIDTNFDDVRQVVVFGSERMLMPPLAERMTGHMWRQLRAKLHERASLCAVGCMGGPTSEAAEIIMHGVPPPIVQIHALDATAWLDVIHEVKYAEQDLQAVSVKDTLNRNRTPTIVVVQTKSDVEKWTSQLRREGADITADSRAFAEGLSGALVISDFSVSEQFRIPPTVGVVINIGLPRRDFEEKLTHRARALLSPAARRLSVCQMTTFVNHQTCNVGIAARLREFLVATHQTVPSVLERLRVRVAPSGEGSRF